MPFPPRLPPSSRAAHVVRTHLLRLPNRDISVPTAVRHRPVRTRRAELISSPPVRLSTLGVGRLKTFVSPHHDLRASPFVSPQKAVRCQIAGFRSQQDGDRRGPNSSGQRRCSRSWTGERRSAEPELKSRHRRLTRGAGTLADTSPGDRLDGTDQESSNGDVCKGMPKPRHSGQNKGRPASLADRPFLAQPRHFFDLSRHSA